MSSPCSAICKALKGALGAGIVVAVLLGASLGAISKLNHDLTIEKIRGGSLVVEDRLNPGGQVINRP